MCVSRGVATQNAHALAGRDIRRADLPEAIQRLQAFGQILGRGGPQQQADLRIGVVQQDGNQGAADRSGGAGNEVVLHGLQ